MAKEGGGITALIWLLCFPCFGTISPGLPMAFATETKLQVQQLLVNTPTPLLGSDKPNHHIESSNQKKGPRHSKGTTPSPTIPKQVNRNGTTWCVVKPSTSQEKLDEIIQYCCTQPNVDCKVIQAGGICYFPPNKISDASVVMNIYYKLNGKHPFNCDFKGSGLIVTADPSVGKCIYRA